MDLAMLHVDSSLPMEAEFDQTQTSYPQAARAIYGVAAGWPTQGASYLWESGMGEWPALRTRSNPWLEWRPSG
jgi:hypothetical protein